MRLISVNYHYLRPEFTNPYPGIFGITPAQFRDQLERLSKIGKFISASDLNEKVRNGERSNEKYILITFDDGLSEQYEHAIPVLDQMGIPAVFFVNTTNIVDKQISTVHKIHMLMANMPPEHYGSSLLESARSLFAKQPDPANAGKGHKHYCYDPPQRAELKYFLNFELTRQEQDIIIKDMFSQAFTGNECDMCSDIYMSAEQVRNLSDRDLLGTHSHRHIPLGLLSAEEITEDIQKSMDHLTEIAGKAPSIISYPYGSAEACSDKVLEISKQLGLETGFTMERAGNHSFSKPLGLARFDCNDAPGGKSCTVPDEHFFDLVPFV